MKKLVLLPTVLILSLLLMLASGGIAQAQEAEVVMRMSGYFPKNHPGHIYQQQAQVDLVSEVTGGRVKVKIYPQLVAGKALYQALQTGLVDFNHLWSPYNPGAFPATDIASLPGLFSNQATSNIVMNLLFEKFPVMWKQYSPDVEVIVASVHMRADIHSRVPIRSIEDLRGKVIGCQDHQIAKALAKLGATVTVIGYYDFYPSLERKVVDGVACAWGSVSALRLYEISKYHTLIGISPGVSHYAFSKKAWDKFTAREQKLLKLMRSNIQYNMIRSNVEASMDVRFNHCIPEKGHEIIIWSDNEIKEMRELLKPIWVEWAEELEKKGYPGKEMLKEAIRLIAAYNLG